MTLDNLIDHSYKKEGMAQAGENGFAINVLAEYIEKRINTEVTPYQNTPNFIESLLYNYFRDKGTQNEDIMIKILESYNFNYSMSIHNAIYYLMGKPEEKEEGITPLSWPGMYDITSKGFQYTLNTKLGKIELYKASDFFANHPSSYIFVKPLMNQCYDRTYDFIKENRDYTAVLSYMPNFFRGGHYHAYLERGSEVLDIASNSFYESKEFADKVLTGELVKKVSFEQIEEDYARVKRECPDLERDDKKLHILTLYYDINNNK